MTVHVHADTIIQNLSHVQQMLLNLPTLFKLSASNETDRHVKAFVTY